MQKLNTVETEVDKEQLRDHENKIKPNAFKINGLFSSCLVPLAIILTHLLLTIFFLKETSILREILQNGPQEHKNLLKKP